MLRRIDRMSVMCMMSLVNILVKMRYMVDRRRAAPVTNKRR